MHTYSGAMNAAKDFWALALCDTVVRTGSGTGGFSTFSMAAHGFASSTPISVSKSSIHSSPAKVMGGCESNHSSQPVLGTSPHTLLKGGNFRFCCIEDKAICSEYKRSHLVKSLCATNSFYPGCQSYDLNLSLERATSRNIENEVKSEAFK
jgi:hypothetical protein